MIRWLAAASLVLVLAGAAGATASWLASGTASADTTVTVPVGDLFFCNSSFEGGTCETDIHAGDTLRWDMSQATANHSATSSTGAFDSGIVRPGGSFQFRFSTPGTYPYVCTVHPTEMRGRIVVAAAPATPTSQPAGPTSTPVLGATATPSGGGTLPVTGYGPNSGGSEGWWWMAALALGGCGLAVAGAPALYRRRRA